MSIVIAWVVLHTSVAAQESECVAPEVRAELARCPAGLARASSNVRRPEPPTFDVPAGSTPPQATPDYRVEPAPAEDPRAEALIERELVVLDRLFTNLLTNDSRRPEVLMRHAETLFELETVRRRAVRAFDEPLHLARTARDTSRARTLARDRSRAEARLEETRGRMIRAYATLITDHPTFPRIDEVLYALALALEEIGQRDRARTVYYRLIRERPESRFVAHAYLAFAERAFEEGDLERAGELYGRVLEFPPERNPVYGYALYKSAWVLYNAEDFRGSLERFVRVIELVARLPDLRDGANLARQARRELVLPYARVGSPNQALAFFRRLMPSEEAALETYERLGELYFDTGEWPDAISVYQSLLATAPSSARVCRWQLRIANAIVSSRPKNEQVRELVRLGDLRALFARSIRDRAAVRQCDEEAAALVIGTAVAWHREAVGTDTQPGTHDATTMRLASGLYALALRAFPSIDRLRFPAVDPRDRPTEVRLRYYHAELLWKMERFEDCGPAFDRVVELAPAGEHSTDAALGAVLCYDRVWQTTHEPRERAVNARASLAPRPFTETERRMADAFARYVCVVPSSEDLATVEYRRARLYYEANRFEEAAVLFRGVADRHPASELAIYAANLHLDSLNALGTMIETPRRACVAELRRALAPLSHTFCEARENASDLCATLARLECDLLRKDAEALGLRGRHGDAGRTLVGVYRDHPECGDGEYRAELLYDAAIHFEAARLLGRAIQVRQALVENHESSRYAALATFQIGANYHALAIYGAAATWYERFASRYPRGAGAVCDEGRTAAARAAPVDACREASAPEALRNAVFFRLGLGEEETALADAELFERHYARSNPRETAAVIFSIGSIYEREANAARVVEHYRRFLQRHQRAAAPQDVVRAHVAIGRALEDRSRAAASYRDALRVFEGGALDAIAALPEGEREQAAYLARDAASEAMFGLAEIERAAFEAIAFPSYRGGRSVERVRAWAHTEFATWIEAKRVALQAAEASYARIAALDVPPWEIAAASRIGTMYRSLTDEFRDAPIPAVIEEDPVAREIYEREVDLRSEPFLLAAIDRFEYCLITATRARWFNEHSRVCELELHRLEPGRYPLAAELRAAPEHAYDGDRRSRPAAIDGAPDPDRNG
jgi:tetratricopeptide (TPR) repeat protein